MANKSPAYQFYPDIWDMHTKHLSDVAYRVYHNILNWMWLHAVDRCSIPDDDLKIAKFTKNTKHRVKKARKEIMDADLPLFLIEEKRLVSKRLRREAEKQQKRHNDAKTGASARWSERTVDVQPAMRPHCASPSKNMRPQCPPQGEGEGEEVSERGECREGDDFSVKHPAYALLVGHPEFRGVNREQYLMCLQRHSRVDPEAAVKRAMDDATLMTGLAAPAAFLMSRFRIVETDGPSAAQAASETKEARESRMYESWMSEFIEKSRVLDEWAENPLPNTAMDVPAKRSELRDDVVRRLGQKGLVDYENRRSCG